VKKNAELGELSEPESVGLVLNKSGLMRLNMLKLKITLISQVMCDVIDN